MELYSHVQDVLHKTCKVDPAAITPDSDLFADLGIESMDFLDAVYELDSSLAIRIPVGIWIGEANEGKLRELNPFVMRNFIAEIEKLMRRSPA